MTGYERLIELLKIDNCPSPMICDPDCKYFKSQSCYEERTADYLLANDVIVPPCKVGDKVYRIWSCGKNGKSISELIITTLSMIDNEGSWIIKTQSKSGRVYQFDLDDIGNKIYVTKEEAVKTLEGSK